MLRAREIALAGFGLLLFSSTSSFAQAGRMCMPAVANPDMYQNCRIAMTPAGEVCRCAIRPAAIRPPALDRNSDQGLSASVGGGALGGGIASPLGRGGVSTPPSGGVSTPPAGGGTVVGGLPGTGPFSPPTGGITPPAGINPPTGEVPPGETRRGNPGNEKMVGKAGEFPNGDVDGWGPQIYGEPPNGIRGRSDAEGGLTGNGHGPQEGR